MTPQVLPCLSEPLKSTTNRRHHLTESPREARLRSTQIPVGSIHSLQAPEPFANRPVSIIFSASDKRSSKLLLIDVHYRSVPESIFRIQEVSYPHLRHLNLPFPSLMPNKKGKVTAFKTIKVSGAVNLAREQDHQSRIDSLSSHSRAIRRV